MTNYPYQPAQQRSAPAYPLTPANPFADQAPNPYAAPQQPGLYAQPVPNKISPYAGLWREGNVLVMHKLAPLPDICLKSNQPAVGRLKRNLSWHHPAIALTILLGLLVYVVLAIVLTKRATIHIALTDEWLARRHRRMIFAWVTGLICLALLVGGIVLAAQTNDGSYIFLTLIGFIGGLVVLIAGQSALAMVSPKRMTDEYIWLKGVHPDFLDRLEVWPYRI
jgi:hypothetical protein